MTPSLPFLSDLPLGPGAPFPASLSPASVSAPTPLKGTADFAELLGSALPPEPGKSAVGAEAGAALPVLATLRATPALPEAAGPAGGTILPDRGASLPDGAETPLAVRTSVNASAAAQAGAAAAASALAAPGEAGAVQPLAMPLSLAATPERAPLAAMLPAPDVSASAVPEVAPQPLPAAPIPPASAEPEAGGAAPAVPAASTRRLAGKIGEMTTPGPVSPGPDAPRGPGHDTGGDGSVRPASETAAQAEETAPPLDALVAPAAGWVQPAIVSAQGLNPAAQSLVTDIPDTLAPAAKTLPAAIPASQRPAALPLMRGKPAEQAAAEPSAPAFGPVPSAPGEAPAASANPVSAEAASAASTPASAPPNPPLPAAVPNLASLAPERVEAPGQAQPRSEPQIESTIAQVGELREALRAARPEMTLRHAEFGFVSVRLEATATPDTWRAVMASRDPGFVPAIQAALADRAVTALSAAPDSGGSGGFGAGQNGTGDQRYGASPNGGQGGSQPYLGHSGQRDGEAAPDHRRPSTAAALAARAEDEAPGSPAPRAGGLFA